MVGSSAVFGIIGMQRPLKKEERNNRNKYLLLCALSVDQRRDDPQLSCAHRALKS